MQGELKSRRQRTADRFQQRVTEPRRDGSASWFRGALWWCTFRQRNRRAKRRAHSCNGSREHRRLGLYAPQKGHRETRRSDNVLDSAGQRVCVLRQPGKLGQGCAERVQAVGTTPQQKGVIHKTLERNHSDQPGLQIRIRSVCGSE